MIIFPVNDYDAIKKIFPFSIPYMLHSSPSLSRLNRNMEIIYCEVETVFSMNLVLIGNSRNKTCNDSGHIFALVWRGNAAAVVNWRDNTAADVKPMSLCRWLARTLHLSW